MTTPALPFTEEQAIEVLVRWAAAERYSIRIGNLIRWDYQERPFYAGMVYLDPVGYDFSLDRRFGIYGVHVKEDGRVLVIGKVESCD